MTFINTYFAFIIIIIFLVKNYLKIYYGKTCNIKKFLSPNSCFIYFFVF